MNDFMKGRYGVDDLSLAIGTVGVALALVGTIFSLREVSLVALVILVLDLARAFSKNFDARRRENDAYRSFVRKIPMVGERLAGGGPSGAASGRASARSAQKEDLKRQARTAKKMWKERKTKAFLKCPKCGTMLSVPKGKGRLIVTCPKCHAKMETRS